MLREMLKSKIHRATVTQSDLNYVGSLTIAADLMEAAGLLPNEKVDLVNLSNAAIPCRGPALSGATGLRCRAESGHGGES